MDSLAKHQPPGGPARPAVEMSNIGESATAWQWNAQDHHDQLQVPPSFKSSAQGGLPEARISGDLTQEHVLLPVLGGDRDSLGGVIHSCQGVPIPSCRGLSLCLPPPVAYSAQQCR